MFDEEFSRAMAELDAIGTEEDYGLESLLYELENLSVAQEGLFHKKKSLDQLLAKVSKRVNKCKTVEACDDIQAKLTAEVSKFNANLAAMKQAAISFKEEQITKDEFKSQIKSLSKELKNTCDILVLGNVTSDAKDVTDEEIALVKDFLTGATALVKARKEEIEAAEDHAESALESLLNELEEDEDVALEGAASYSFRLRWGEEKKAAKKLIGEAKKLKRKDPEAAIKKYQEAKAIFKGLMAKLSNIPDSEIASYRIPTADGSTVEATKTKTYSTSKKMAKNYFAKMIFNCDEAIEIIENRLLKAARRSAGKAATESFIEKLAFDGDEDEDITDADFE